MTRGRRAAIDKVRASRDGHEFHEAWAARKALQLVIPPDDLVGIAVEGLSPSDQESASAKTVEIADLALYYGRQPSFAAARQTVIVQLKYSHGSKDKPFRASDAKKTVTKFAAAFRSYVRQYGTKLVEGKLTFQLVTNRPILEEFSSAVEAVGRGASLKGAAKKQAKQFAAASKLKGRKLARFASSVRFIGLAGSLGQNKSLLSRTVVDWSAALDAEARARLAAIKELLRNKAGLEGQGRNVIRRTDVLDALGVQSPDDLLPCPASFPPVGDVVRREQLENVVSRIPKLEKPLVVHAAGGVGKTVFLQSLAAILGASHKSVLFDSFGGGAYRAPEDARHLPQRGLTHIVNSLACDGLCDPLLPSGVNVEELVKAFRLRLSQAVKTLRRGSKQQQLLLFLDAIDNAAEHAKDRREQSFPSVLLQSFCFNKPVEGVQLIVSCRTHRREIALGGTPCEQVELRPFSLAEAQEYLRARVAGVTETQVQVAYSRSEGNPRVLEHLVTSDRGLLDPSELNRKIELSSLIEARIRGALRDASSRGYSERASGAFLAGLAVLPPPVPVDEYSDAHGLEVSAVRSFAADLAPLLEHTSHGLIFRDEPTETFVRERFAADPDALNSVVENLLAKQGTSVYAASALPGLLEKLGDAKRLFDLAFDERLPSTVKSAVGKQRIRYARLKAAVRHAARIGEYDRLVKLLVELSTLAAVNQRGADYILKVPDLVVASHDVDATRRLFETRTQWPGTRHARLTIASVLAGDIGTASRHAIQTSEWIDHFFRQPKEYFRDHSGPEALDVAAIPLRLIAEGRTRDAAEFLTHWRHWFSYEVGEQLFALLLLAQRMDAIPARAVNQFIDSLTTPGALAAALSFGELGPAAQIGVIKALAESCAKTSNLETNNSFRGEERYRLEHGMLNAAATALSRGQRAEALTILSAIRHERPRLWSFATSIATGEVFAFLAYVALGSALEGHSPNERAILPSELADVGASVPPASNGGDFRRALAGALDELGKSERGLPSDKKKISDDTRRDAERFITHRLPSVLAVAESLNAVITSQLGHGDQAFQALLELWAKLRRTRPPYDDPSDTDHFFDLLGRHALMFALRVRGDLGTRSVAAFVARFSEEGAAPASTLIEAITGMAKRPALHEMAGKLAKHANSLIEREDDVGSRASLFSDLSRAILPASFDEAAVYFRAGLEQMDAIGSGDYAFTNELLLFAGELKGDELGAADFHVLLNICELNMSYEAEKFPWAAFGAGMSRVSGLSSMARLGRWDDREKASLDYTLLPYLLALIEQDKIDPAVALGLLRLCDPAELWTSGTAQLASVIEKKRFRNSNALVTEQIRQFLQNHPRVFMSSTVATLAEIAKRELGTSADLTTALAEAAPRYKNLTDEGNELRNYRGAREQARAAETVRNVEVQAKSALEQLADAANPTDDESLTQAVERANAVENAYGLKAAFFDRIRARVSYSERAVYVRSVARLQTLDLYPKLAELKRCRDAWSESSAALDDVFRGVATPVIQGHADEFVSFDHLSGSQLKELADVSGSEVSALVLELVSVFAQPDAHVSAPVWMGLAAAMCARTTRGEGQSALRRLLNSASARLASSVTAGEFKRELYPGRETEVAAGMVWLRLGAPLAASRWRAAHSIRSFARLGKWEVVDALVRMIDTKDAHPYQAPEVPFFFLHARLWLLIALARTAADHPESVAHYVEVLKGIALDDQAPHVLCRHFAARALLECAGVAGVELSQPEMQALHTINDSKVPRAQAQSLGQDSFYGERPRPAGVPEPRPEFSFDYDFDKHDIQRLTEVFGRDRWETKDAITKWIRKYDPHVKSMHETGGRAAHQRTTVEMSTRRHRYGQQLAWHGLHLAAGEFLPQYPVVRREYDEDDPWNEWLRRELLTRDDGLWLADGVDTPPLEAQVNVSEKGSKGVALTGDRERLLSLVGIESSRVKELVAAGAWRSEDGIEIHVDTALVPPERAKRLAAKLSKEDAFQAWLPAAEAYEDEKEYVTSDRAPFAPWIVWPSGDARLDETDPLGAGCVARRLRFTAEIAAIASLTRGDPFGRTWRDPDGRIAARSEAWGRSPTHDQERPIDGLRLVCSPEFLERVLAHRASELLVLLKLRRYVEGSGATRSEFWHTTAVVRVDQSLAADFYPGVVNKLHVTRY